MFCAGSYESVTPRPCAVEGMSCISPCAPAELVAFGLKPDSCATIARTSAGSTPSWADDAAISVVVLPVAGVVVGSETRSGSL